jgi:hypothetical protein
MYLLTKMARLQDSLINLIAWSESLNHKNVIPWSILFLQQSKLKRVFKEGKILLKWNIYAQY